MAYNDDWDSFFQWLGRSRYGAWYRWTYFVTLSWSSIGAGYSQFGAQGAMAICLFYGLFLLGDTLILDPQSLATDFANATIPFLVGALTSRFAPTTVDIEFYKAAAQALPVLLLAFVHTTGASSER